MDVGQRSGGSNLNIGNTLSGRKFIVLSIVLLVSAAFAGCLQGGDGDGDGDAEALKIGTILPITGDLNAYGTPGENAVKLAVSQINAAGGVNGEDVELAHADTETSQNTGPAEAQRLVNVEGVHGLIGAYSSGVTTPIVEQSQNFGVPIISPASTAPTLSSSDVDTNNIFYRTVASDALQGQVMAQLAKDEGYSTASLIVVNNAYGVGFGDVFEEEFGQAQVLNYVKYDPTGTTFDSDVQDATSPVEPDVVVLVGYPDTGASIMQAAHEQNVAGPNSSVDWLFSEGVKDTAFPDQVNKTEDGEYIIAGYKGTTPVFQNPGDWVKMYSDEYGSEPALFADGAYDSAVLFALASETCDCTSGDEFHDALFDVANAPGQEYSDVENALSAAANGEDVNWNGWTGVEWDENGDMTTGTYAIWQVTEDGNIETTESGITP